MTVITYNWLIIFENIFKHDDKHNDAISSSSSSSSEASHYSHGQVKREVYYKQSQTDTLPHDRANSLEIARKATTSSNIKYNIIQDRCHQ